MALKSLALEIGMGIDIRGGDYTKAALRAVQDALHHSSLTMIRTLESIPDIRQVEQFVRDLAHLGRSARRS